MNALATMALPLVLLLLSMAPSPTVALAKDILVSSESHGLIYGGSSANDDSCVSSSSNLSSPGLQVDSSHGQERETLVVDLSAAAAASIEASSDINKDNDDDVFWPTSRPLPPVTPSPKTVVFMAHFFVSTDVNHMLLMAEELRQRGHHCHFIVMETYVKRVEKAGFTATGTPNVLQGDGLEIIQRAFTYASHQTGTFTYIYKYIMAVVPLAAKYYEPSMIIFEEYIAKHGKPDLLVASKASESAIEVAHYEGIPFSVLFTMPLGGMINAYEDLVAAPDANLWGGVKEHASMWMRLRKILGRLAMLCNPVTGFSGARLAWARFQRGYYPFAVPGDHWRHSMIISPWSMGIDLARPLRPLTQLVGFMTGSLPELPHDDASMAAFSPEDQEHLRYLNSKTDGVVFCAFGSLAVLTQEWFDELVIGMDLWAKARGPNSGAVIAVNELSLKSGLDVSRVPDTVQVTGWINQRLFLVHPHTQAFVTHGGLGSLGEAIEARVPMLVFPLFFDQPNNAHRLEEAGVALKLHFREERVTSGKVASRLTKLTSDPSFAHNLAKQYQINKRAGGVSRAIDLLEDALLWEGNLGHLIPVDERASFFQRTNLDLYMVILLLAAAFIKTVVWQIVNPLMQRYRIRARLEAMTNKAFEEAQSSGSISGSSLHEQ